MRNLAPRGHRLHLWVPQAFHVEVLKEDLPIDIHTLP